MATRETRAQRGHRAAQRARTYLCGEYWQQRVQLGLSQTCVAAATGISPSYYGRIERGEVRAPTFEVLWAIGAALGLDLRLSVFPYGEPVHDQAQLPILETARALLPASTAWRTEVVLPGDGDLRAWDAVAMAPDGWTAFEAISRLGVVDATVRHVHQKLRDDPRIMRPRSACSGHRSQSPGTPRGRWCPSRGLPAGDARGLGAPQGRQNPAAERHRGHSGTAPPIGADDRRSFVHRLSTPWTKWWKESARAAPSWWTTPLESARRPRIFRLARRGR